MFLQIDEDSSIVIANWSAGNGLVIAAKQIYNSYDCYEDDKLY